MIWPKQAHAWPFLKRTETPSSCSGFGNDAVLSLNKSTLTYLCGLNMKIVFLGIREVSHDAGNPMCPALFYGTEHVTSLSLRSHPQPGLLGSRLTNEDPEAPNRTWLAHTAIPHWERPTCVNYNPDQINRRSTFYHSLCHSSNYPEGKPQNLLTSNFCC